MRAARAKFFETGQAPYDIPPEIVTSWQRSLWCGLRPDNFALPYRPDFNPESQLLRAAHPVLARLEEDLAGSRLSIVLADRHSRVVYRWASSSALLRQLDCGLAAPGFVYGEAEAGTNGIGTTVQHERPTCIRGGEHFADQLQLVTCVGVPLRHPVTGRLEGVLDLTCFESETNPLMLSLASGTAHEIRLRLFEQASLVERRLLEEYVALQRHARHPVACIGTEMMIASAAAADALRDVDRELLLDEVVRASRLGRLTGEFQVAEELRVRFRSVHDGKHLMGAVLEVLKVPRAGASIVVRDTLPPLVGASPTWRDICRSAHRHAITSSNVVIVGEPGVGTTAVARALAELARGSDGGSRRKPVPEWDAATPNADLCAWVDEVAVCSSPVVVVRHLDAADVETVQALRRALEQSSGGQCRLFATITRPRADVSLPPHLAPMFGAELHIPPLQFRREDVPELAAALLSRCRGDGGRAEFSTEALRALMRYDWPGNVAELEKVTEAVAAVKPFGRVKLADLPERYWNAAWQRPLARLEQIEMNALVMALRVHDGNKQAAADWLGISRSTMYRKLRAFRIDPGTLPGLESTSGEAR